MPSRPEDSSLSLSEAAVRLGCSAHHVRQLRTYGLLEPAVVGRRHAVTRRSVDEYAAELPPQRKPFHRKRRHLRLVIDNT